jgi:hypothetical protein
MSFAPPEPVEGTPPEHVGPDDQLTVDPDTLTPAAIDPRQARPAPRIRPGDLAMPWRVMLGLSWLMAFFAYAAVWQASVQIGIGTWWLGARADPAPTAMKLIPFGLSLAMALLVIYNVPRVARVSLAGVALTALLSVPDFSRTTGLGVAELIIAGLLGLITVSSLSGQYRRSHTDPATIPAPPA